MRIVAAVSIVVKNLVIITLASAQAQTPTLIQHVSTGANNDVSYNAGTGNPGNPFGL